MCTLSLFVRFVLLVCALVSFVTDSTYATITCHRQALDYYAARDLPSIMTDVNSNHAASDLRRKFHELQEKLRSRH